MRNPPVRTRPHPRLGFTLPELVVVMALGTLIITLLFQALMGQRHFYEAQRAATDRNETIRFGMAVLGSAFRESKLSEGDVDILAPNRVRVRVPHGFGVVCGAETDGSRIGVVGLRGRWTAGPGDSLLVQRTSGGLADRMEQVQGASAQVPCVSGGGLLVRLTQAVPDVVQGSPARSFRSQLFESGIEDGSHWLYRVDGGQREILLGPLEATEGFRVWFEDASGVEVFNAAGADRALVRIIARSPDVRGQPMVRRDTLIMTFGGRNR